MQYVILAFSNSINIIYFPLEQEETEADIQAKELEVQGVKCAENNDLDGAISFFNQAVTVAPNRASCYNNRAQALRLRGDVEGDHRGQNDSLFGQS